MRGRLAGAGTRAPNRYTGPGLFQRLVGASWSPRATTGTPGDETGTPGVHDAALTVGAWDASDRIASSPEAGPRCPDDAVQAESRAGVGIAAGARQQGTSLGQGDGRGDGARSRELHTGQEAPRWQRST